MSENKQYSLPKFVVEQLTKDFSYSENELEKASDIYSRAAKFNYPSSNTGENWSKLVLNITEPKMVKKETPTFKISYWWSAAAIVVIGLTFVFLQNLNPSKEIVSTQTYKTLDEIRDTVLLSWTKNIEENPTAASILCKTKCRKNQIIKRYYDV